MAFNITLQPSGLQFAAAEDRTILEAAEDAGISLPCGCRSGNCGTCKGRLTEGNVERGSEDALALTEAEHAAGFTLLCGAKPRSDAVIEVTDAVRGVATRKFLSRIASMERVAPDVLAVTLKLQSPESFDFRAGQYIELLFKDGERRAFSLANAPHDKGQIQLHIRLVEGSFATRMFTEVLKVRDLLRFRGPLGSFHLNDDSTKPIIMLAGGTGFAPIKAILDDMAHQGIRREVHLYRGARDRAGLYLPQLPKQWAEAMPHFTHVPVLSDPVPADSWDGRPGLVHQAVLEDFADMSGFEVYACGAMAMVEAAHREFSARGLPSDAFFADAFTPAAKKQ